MTGDTRNVWHPGELAVQSRAGVKDQMAELGPRLIRDFMPDQHRDFFSRLPMVIIDSEDGSGHLWATPLFGAPGFIETPSPQLLTINASAPHLQAGNQVGLLGIELEKINTSSLLRILNKQKIREHLIGHLQHPNAESLPLE